MRNEYVDTQFEVELIILVKIIVKKEILINVLVNN